MSNPSDQRSWK